ncbi:MULTISPECIES: FecR family protein [Flavobacteriaceae]|uniref:FecR family protein n=1 Tax=Flavobacteriaceae TaxID=49546 RepID=UPI0014930DE8|nr:MULTISPECIES: FecR domain-containing protein [Allomuricauda]MDC6366789.1 FecR domain-containing protein [Muricauda sp. AC10]
MKKKSLEDRLNTKEREHLKKRISASIFKYRRRRVNMRRGIGLAMASVVFILSIGVYFYYSESSSIENYVEATSNVVVDASEDVTLILEKNKSVNLDEENSSISYSQNGQKVKIGTNGELAQSNTKNSEIVFNTLMVPYGRRAQIQLSDGSKVWLNSGSKLVYPVSFQEERREVYLEGEGIFEVAHNKEQPFIVKSENHEVEVLGTVFNVSNYLDDASISTTLKSGSVQIRYKSDSFFKNKEVMKVSPGVRTVYDKNSTKIFSNKVDVNKYFSWREGVLIFKNDDLGYIMKKLSRYYNVKISVENKELKSQTFSGYLDLKEDVESVVGTIQKTTEFDYNFNDNQLIIH